VRYYNSSFREGKMEAKKKQIFTGIITIIISIIVLIVNLKLFEEDFGKLWPTLLLLLGVILYIFYFATKKRHKRVGLSFLATFVSVSSIPLFILTFTSFEHFNYIWPGFILAIGCGLTTVYLYGERRRGTLFFAQVLIALPLLIWIFFAMRSKFGLVIGVVLLMIGVAFLARGLIRDNKPSVSVSDLSESEGEGDVGQTGEV
jgi:drug/metabolite transporter (DMT)-like permease